MQRIFCILFMGLVGVFATSVEAQSLTLNDDQRCQRDYEFNLQSWAGFSPTRFEHPTCYREEFRLSGNFVSNRERALDLPHYQTLKQPVSSSSFYSNQNGFSPSYGENYFVSADGASSFRTESFFLRASILGGVHQSPWKPFYHLPYAYGEARWQSLIFSIGRKPIYWGQSFISPLMLSFNATPMDSFQISTLPVRLPGFLDWFGEFRSEVFLSRMNSDREPENDYFFGWRLGWKPIEEFETNVSMIYQFGGNHGYDDSLSDFLTEFVGARPNNDVSNTTGSATNRSVSWDLRAKFNTAWPLTLYGENHLEDCCGNITDVIKYRLSYAYGAALKLGSAPDSFVFRTEFLKTSNLLNFHGKWPSAFSNDGSEMGPYLGRDAHTFAIDLEKSNLNHWIKFSRVNFFYQKASRHHAIYYTSTPDPLSRYYGSYQEPESRYGSIVDLEWPLSDMSLKTSGGYAFVKNKFYQRDKNAHYWATSFTLIQKF